MGLIANYNCLSDANLKELKAMAQKKRESLIALKSGEKMMSYCLISTRCGMYSISCLPE